MQTVTEKVKELVGASAYNADLLPEGAKCQNLDCPNSAMRPLAIARVLTWRGMENRCKACTLDELHKRPDTFKPFTLKKE